MIRFARKGREQRATDLAQVYQGITLEVPKDLLPGTGQQRITRSRLHYPRTRCMGNCQRSITKLSFLCYPNRVIFEAPDGCR